MLSNNKKLIAVIGATGHQGGGAIRALKPGGQLKGGVCPRNPGAHPAPPEEVMEADLNRPEPLAAAFKGAQGVFLVTPSSLEGPDERKQGPAAVKAASD